MSQVIHYQPLTPAEHYLLQHLSRKLNELVRVSKRGRSLYIKNCRRCGPMRGSARRLLKQIHDLLAEDARAEEERASTRRGAALGGQQMTIADVI